MPTVRTLTALGAALGQQIPALARVATGHLTLSHSGPTAERETSLEVLLDRLCLSLTLAKPVGLVTWAEREAAKHGCAHVVDTMCAATQAIAGAGAAVRVDRSRLHAFLEVLTREVERAALGAAAEDEPRDEGSQTATALIAMLCERDFGTGCHSKATAEWGRRLAIALDCDSETADFIALCALLHDIGKISTPDNILQKAGPLDEDEWELMREHASAGARILNQVPSLRRCAVVVRAHHERFDGTGYPDGLAGTSIPLEARVVAVADAFHAMISERPYRAAIAPRQALQILEEGRGSQWDPEVVDAMLRMLSRRQAVPAHRSVSSA